MAIFSRFGWSASPDVGQRMRFFQREERMVPQARAHFRRHPTLPLLSTSLQGHERDLLRPHLPPARVNQDRALLHRPELSFPLAFLLLRPSKDNAGKQNPKGKEGLPARDDVRQLHFPPSRCGGGVVNDLHAEGLRTPRDRFPILPSQRFRSWLPKRPAQHERGPQDFHSPLSISACRLRLCAGKKR